MDKGCSCFMCRELGDPECCVAPVTDHLVDVTDMVDQPQPEPKLEPA